MRRSLGSVEAKPSPAASRKYSAGARFAKLYAPMLSETVLRIVFVERSVRMTRARATGAADESTTVPLSETCANAFGSVQAHAAIGSRYDFMKFTTFPRSSAR